MKPQAERSRGLRHLVTNYKIAQSKKLTGFAGIGVHFISNYLIIFANKIEEICLAISNLEFLEHYP